jgi:ferritin
MAKKSSADQPISREKLAALLNEDLSREYQAIIAYVVYSQVLKGPQYMNIADQLATHAQQELEHALIISRQIVKTRMKPSATTVNGFGNAKRWVNLRWRSKFDRFLSKSKTIKSILRLH